MFFIKKLQFAAKTGSKINLMLFFYQTSNKKKEKENFSLLHNTLSKMPSNKHYVSC